MGFYSFLKNIVTSWTQKKSSVVKLSELFLLETQRKQ